MDTKVELATLAGGCFWCLEPIYESLRGVSKVVPGYAGGQTANPTYREICSGTTGHAEVVEISFEPKVVSFADLLRIFFTIHDPTTLNRQGGDVGTQYRSAIFTHSDAQRRTAEDVRSEIAAAGIWRSPLVTEIVPLTRFYLAEEYHHRYYERNPEQGYCRVVIDPKVAKFRKSFAEMLAK